MSSYPRGRGLRVIRLTAMLSTVGAVGIAGAAPAYHVSNVLVAQDQWQGEAGVTPAPVYKPHETTASLAPSAGRMYWISSNERGDETVPPGKARNNPANRAGITIFEHGTNTVLSTLEVENACIPVIAPDGSVFNRFGKCAPPGAEGHPRHAHGVEIDEARGLAYQVLEHSGLKWTPDRSGFQKASKTDDESGLLVVYDIRDLAAPKILAGYVLGHAAEEVAVHRLNGKAYVGNHEPSPTTVPCFVSVIDHAAAAPYKFIDLPGAGECVQGIDVDEGLDTVNGTTHVGEKMFTFDSVTDTIAYSVNIRGAFESFVAGLPAGQKFEIPAGWVMHMHDLVTDKTNHRAYQTIHTLAEFSVIEAETDENSTAPEADEITGRWVAEVDTDPTSSEFRRVRIIDLSNGQYVPAVRTHHDAIATGLPFEQLFVHGHFLAVDPTRSALIVSGEHTGNVAVVDTTVRLLTQTLPISRRIPGCKLLPDSETGEIPLIEPHVHGVKVQLVAGTVYIADEGEDCLYESVTVLDP